MHVRTLTPRDAAAFQDLRLYGLRDSSARTRGAGSQLVAEALSYARSELGLRQVSLAVNAANIAAISLYRKLGFEQFGLERGSKLLNGELHDEVHMVCLLPPAP